MKNNGFYNSIAYKERQSEIAMKNWQIGIYDFLRKQEKRQCVNPECGKCFEVKPADTKKFCSRKCAAQVNNPKRSNMSFQIKEKIVNLYQRGLSMQEIADKTGWKHGKVVYWMHKFGISRRSRSEANYIKYNPTGDPFEIKKLKTKKDIELFNLGIGLFLGEGTKRNKFNVTLANSNPEILRLFLKFLREICGVNETKIKAALNIFDDVNLTQALNFWSKVTNIPLSRFGKTMVRKSRGGTYKNKSLYGTLTIYVPNIKLKTLMDKWCKKALTHCS
ncbi:MAG: hypothetical protein Q8N87_01010 [bacterium]|nr:hypothetical protein [bacterium]